VTEHPDGPAPGELTVPVAGGDLAVLHWPGDPALGADTAPPVVAVHGITANAQVWAPLARRLPGRHLYAPDLRGRARSRALPGPWGMAAHVADLRALLDHLAATGPAGDGPVVLVGHSMGAFVATLAAARHPARFTRVVLVDGGLGVRVPPGDIDTQLDLVIGPAVRRLSMTFPDADAVLGIKLLNNRPINALIEVDNHESASIQVAFVAGSLSTTKELPADAPSYQSILRNLTAVQYSVDIEAGEKKSLTFPFALDLHPQDVNIKLVAVVMDTKGNIFQVPALEDRASVVDPPVSFFDPQM
jgi:pimeloyl-ACP methyl ester carboxylesterase